MASPESADSFDSTTLKRFKDFLLSKLPVEEDFKNEIARRLKSSILNAAEKSVNNPDRGL